MWGVVVDLPCSTEEQLHTRMLLDGSRPVHASDQGSNFLFSASYRTELWLEWEGPAEMRVIKCHSDSQRAVGVSVALACAVMRRTICQAPAISQRWVGWKRRWANVSPWCQWGHSTAFLSFEIASWWGAPVSHRSSHGLHHFSRWSEVCVPMMHRLCWSCQEWERGANKTAARFQEVNWRYNRLRLQDYLDYNVSTIWNNQCFISILLSRYDSLTIWCLPVTNERLSWLNTLLRV